MNMIQFNFNTTEKEIKKLYRCFSICSTSGIHCCIVLDFRSKQWKAEHPVSIMMTGIFNHKFKNYRYIKYTDVAILYKNLRALKTKL